MVCCMHLHVAALHATAGCWHPELSVLSYALYAMNWSLDYTDHAHLVSFFHNSDHARVTIALSPHQVATRLE